MVNEPAGKVTAVDSLRDLLERLVAPELTLPEAKLLRLQISQLMGQICPDRERAQIYL